MMYTQIKTIHNISKLFKSVPNAKHVKNYWDVDKLRRFPEIAGWSARMSLYEMLFPTGDAPYPSIRGSPVVGDSIL